MAPMLADDSEQKQGDDDESEQHGLNESRGRYYAYQVAIGGTASCVGLPIQPSAHALQMR
jgi:hypothetical protein